MPEMRTRRSVQPPRKVVFTNYEGPKSGLAAATHLLYAWVGTYYASAVRDVTVFFADREYVMADADTRIEVEVVFEVEETFPSQTKLPDGMRLKPLPSETLLYHVYSGPLTGLRDRAAAWLRAVNRKHTLKPGYRQRMVRTAQKPTDPDWEVELMVALG